MDTSNSSVSRSSPWRRLRRLCVLCWALAALALAEGASAATVSGARHGAALEPTGGASGVALAGRGAGPSSSVLTSPLIHAPALHAVLGRVRVVDLRDPDDYAAGHVPGAVSAPYASWRGPASDPGALLPVEQFQRLVRSLGIDASTPVVLVSDGDGGPGDFGAPARVYWTLQWLGVEHLAILDGGQAAWTAAGLGVSRDAVAAAPSAFVAHPRADLLAQRPDLAARIASGRAPTLLDARPAAFWAGRAMAPAATRPGTLPGATDFDSSRWFDADGRLLGPDALRRVAAALPQPRDGVVSFCNTGHLAAVNWFVLSQLLHVPGTRLYPGSMVDWSASGEPMANVPSRYEQLRAQLVQTWRAL